ncbi:Uncharacterised protein [Serratia entomophila]|jgi:hypothetical protein|uniref:Uncharacterized protein n=1 Tax=Serratia entomophila TaxID=42906 RepID=A0ABY5CM96_9GAMM|nr:hypothetical protein [Serratia entomophila]UIW16346.1 hypothetical protein KHA73_12885 [Serratia entomophila]USU98904.1 hypothetical protein KFQ06_12535 [Serratia entomophila]CAI0699124.1 Uncharacterised protein [Serratia entomophila]CAI0785491.1 Uncharacterised protein [Serratia entomophila]CAI0786602.1 Uncharacterised protein [Serratia entomophila]
MLRDHLKLNDSDTLEKIRSIHLQNQGQEEISEFVVKDAAGNPVGTVSVHDRLSTRRSYPTSYRITQTDMTGRVVVDAMRDCL